MDASNNIVKDSVNAGSYNFYNPKIKGVDINNPLLVSNLKHTNYDASSYLVSGNDLKDTTTLTDRISRNLHLLVIWANE